MRRITFQQLKFMGSHDYLVATVNRPQDKHSLRFLCHIDSKPPRQYSAYELDDDNGIVSSWRDLDEITAMAILHHFRYGADDVT